MSNVRDSYPMADLEKQCGATTPNMDHACRCAKIKALARRALQAVKDLRRDYEAALDEIPHPVVEPLICSGCGRHIPCRHCPPGTPAVPDKDVCEEHGVNINNAHHRAKYHLK